MTEMEKMIERIARELAPLAWAALDLGDTQNHASRRSASLRQARRIVGVIREQTYGIIGHDKTYSIELYPFSFSDVSRQLRLAGASVLIGADGVIRAGVLRIQSKAPPSLDYNGIGLPDEGNEQ
jgi:hypothetical protein